MKPCIIAAALAATIQPVHAQAPSVPRVGTVISRSTTFRPGEYLLRTAASTASAVIVVRGNDVTIDLSGVRLVGIPANSDPDRAAGVAILVDGGNNVTIKNARIRGYKIGILARGTRNLRLIDNDLSRNWKPRLYSIVEHESLVDWLSFHHNEKGEWLRYGAAMYLDGVRGGEIRGNTVQQGMNALLLTRTDSLLVWNNNFSFNSGLGIGLYRSSHNRLMHNRVDYDIRGYSDGFYRRGQDSAGILIYEQSDSNTIAYNSVTHGGDGLFLWAGQHTMDTGEGGANDNVVHGNDFSWAPANGIEATFSRNAFHANRLHGNDYGVWGGYSYDSEIADNDFAGNRVGIAIEHGQESRIIGNTFRGDSTAIWLWANAIEPSDWGYPKHRDTQSRDYAILRNRVTGARVAVRAADSHRVAIDGNDIAADSTLVAKGDTSNFSAPPVFSRQTRRSIAPPPVPGAREVPRTYANWPRSTIVVDDWGPYDWANPKLWPLDSSFSTPLRLRVLGPARMRAWRLVRARGASVSTKEGRVGDTLVVTPSSGRIEDWTVTLAAGSAAFSYSRFDAKLAWAVRVYAWSHTTHPITATAAFADLLRGNKAAPVLSLTTSRLDYVWFRPHVQGWPLEKVGVSATADVELPEGNYSLRTISDDGIRVYLDDRLVIDDWTVHESLVHEAPIAPGRHRLKVEYFQADGWTELRTEIVKRPD